MTTSIPTAAKSVIQELKDAGFKAFLVGGCVRDMLRGVTPHDWDIATSATPEQVVAMFARTIPTGIAHGTVTVCWDQEQFEVTTFRSEGTYTDGRRPDEVRFETDIVADLSRRDFTINAMAFDPTSGELVDPFDGQADLAAGIVRCVGDANVRFQEDGLRCMRAIRFASTLNLSIQGDTFAAIRPNLDVFAKVAMERVQSEFIKILLSPIPVWGLLELQRSGLLNAIFGGSLCDGFHLLANTRFDLAVRLAILVRTNTNDVGALAPLKLPTAVTKRVEMLLKFPLPNDGATNRQLREWLRNVENNPETVLQAQNMDQALVPCPASEDLILRIARLSKDPLFPKDLALDGTEIMAILGCKPGKQVGVATRMLMEAVLDDPDMNEPLTLAQMLTKVLP